MFTTEVLLGIIAVLVLLVLFLLFKQYQGKRDLELEMVRQLGQPLLIEVAGDGDVLERRPELVPHLCIQRVRCFFADHHGSMG